MWDILKLAGSLTLITVVAAGALSRVYLMTRDRIAEVERLRELNAMKTALPAATVFEPDTTSDGFIYYRGYPGDSTGGEPVGYVALALGKGYSSTIRTMVGVDGELTITGIKVASQLETPGLGTRIEEVRRGEDEPWFQDQFRGKKETALQLVRGGGPDGIEAITGATISSRAVSQSVRETVRKLDQVIN
ncbi:MAG: FMN-binding protein [Candidatus Glassbacteria bacterium]|nr:FMN-binding protein [Candidatus Glassbacteria bacterium]